MQASYGMLGRAHKRVGYDLGYPAKLNRLQEAIALNAKVTEGIVQLGREEFSDRLSRVDWQSAGVHGDVHRVRESLKHFVRDWSEDGREERAKIFGPILDVLQDVKPAARQEMRVLIPGSGLGRLAWEVSQMAECDFLGLDRPPALRTGGPAGYDFIVTLFFIDTSLNIVETLEHIHGLLKPGGTWINLGPLLWTGGGQAALELSLEEVLRLAGMIGFEIASDTDGPRRRRTIECEYTADREAMMRWLYQARFWVATKLRSERRSPRQEGSGTAAAVLWRSTLSFPSPTMFTTYYSHSMQPVGTPLADATFSNYATSGEVQSQRLTIKVPSKRNLVEARPKIGLRSEERRAGEPPRPANGMPLSPNSAGPFTPSQQQPPPANPNGQNSPYHGFAGYNVLGMGLPMNMLNGFQYGSPMADFAQNNATGRTVYVGNLPATASVDELLNLVHFGPLESIRVLPEKSCVFLSFLDGATAAAFHADALVKKLSLHGQELKIGWGKPSAVPSQVALAIQQSNASRNVYLGGRE
ncbi:hypothetical protein EVJ58_g10109 [Rhodofomes roseus]|uniref:RRM domain-containing protein n=1 Tax=Rhodofomes roseus TaxID=34475 RepID=A0A4Y9XQ97_9APHY|nr:hypothetical protein EVJ58_g10109 [Rhodofomes roseus]